MNPQQMSEEQMQELQEKLKGMYPEELKEFQKKQCIFCHIVSGKMKARKIYEDDVCIAVMDINPAAPGHLLLLPKEHYTVMPQVPDDVLGHIFIVCKGLSNAMLRSIEARGTNIVVANGPTAGQKAQHFMVHLIPRRENDGLQFSLPQRKISEESLKQVRETLSKRIAELTGAKAVPKPAAKEKPEATKPAAEKPSKKPVKEAEFSEKEQEKKPKQKKSPKKSKKETGKADLDDIARVFGL